MEKIFANGLRVSLPNKGAPKYIIGNLSFKVDEFIAFLKQHEKVGGFVNVSMKISREGKPYAELDTWTPKQDRPEVVRERYDDSQEVETSEPTIEYPEEESSLSDIPF